MSSRGNTRNGADKAFAAVKGHEGKGDPHPQYLLPSELPQTTPSWFTFIPDDITPAFFKQIAATPTTPESSIGPTTITVDGQLIAQWVTEDPVPADLSFRETAIKVILDSEISGGGTQLVELHFELSVLEADNVTERLLTTSDTSLQAEGREVAIMEASAQDYQVLAGERTIVRLYATDIGGSNARIQLWAEGTGTSRQLISFPFSSAENEIDQRKGMGAWKFQDDVLGIPEEQFFTTDAPLQHQISFIRINNRTADPPNTSTNRLILLIEKDDLLVIRYAGAGRSLGNNYEVTSEVVDHGDNTFTIPVTYRGGSPDAYDPEAKVSFALYKSIVVNVGVLALPSGTVPGADIGSGWTPLDAATVIRMAPVGMNFLGNGQFTFSRTGLWSLNLYLSFEHDEQNQGRQTGFRIFDVTSGTAGDTNPVFVGRNVGGTSVSLQVLVEVGSSVLGDVFQLEIGGGSTFTSIIYHSQTLNFLRSK